MIMLSEWLTAQGVWGYAVILNSTDPAAISPAEGRYVGVKVLGFDKVPVPVTLVHNTEAACWAEAVDTVKLEPSHISPSNPA